MRAIHRYQAQLKRTPDGGVMLGAALGKFQGSGGCWRLRRRSTMPPLPPPLSAFPSLDCGLLLQVLRDLQAGQAGWSHPITAWAAQATSLHVTHMDPRTPATCTANLPLGSP